MIPTCAQIAYADKNSLIWFKIALDSCTFGSHCQNCNDMRTKSSLVNMRLKYDFNYNLVEHVVQKDKIC